MLGRDKIALVRKFSKDQAALQEQLKDLGRDPMLKRLDVPENCAESKMSAWLRRRQVNQQPAPADDWNQEELDPVVEILHAANPPQMPRPARPRAADPGNLETEDPPSDDLSSVENVGNDREYDNEVQNQSGDEVDPRLLTLDLNNLPPGVPQEPPSPCN